MQFQFEQVLLVSQVQGRSRWGFTFALFQQVGDVFTSVSLKLEGVLQGASDFVVAVELAQGDDLLDMVRSIEPLLLEPAHVKLGLGAQAQEGLQASLLARTMAMD